MATNKQKMWVVMTDDGIGHIGRDACGAEKGHFWLWVSKSLGYVPVFRNKEDALRFSRKARKLKIVKHAWIQEVEFYKQEMDK